MDDDRWDEQVGSVAEEAQRLLESLRLAGTGDGEPRDREERAAGSTDESDARGHGDGPDGGAEADDEPWTCTDPFCRSCPLCRTVAAVRGLSPETLRRLADLATVAAGVLTDLAGERARRADDDVADPDDRPDAGRPPSRPSAARPIRVRDADPGSGPGTDDGAARG